MKEIVLSKLYRGQPCSSCALRFDLKATKEYGRHLDEHFLENRKLKKKLQKKNWFSKIDKWVGEVPKKAKPLPSYQNAVCNACREPFAEFYNNDEEEWQLKNAICIESKSYHPSCIA